MMKRVLLALAVLSLVACGQDLELRDGRVAVGDPYECSPDVTTISCVDYRFGFALVNSGPDPMRGIDGVQIAGPGFELNANVGCGEVWPWNLDPQTKAVFDLYLLYEDPNHNQPSILVTCGGPNQFVTVFPPEPLPPAPMAGDFHVKIWGPYGNQLDPNIAYIASGSATL